MKIDAPLITTNPLDAGPAAKRLEDAGYDGATTYEGPHDPFLPVLAAAMTTERIELMTSIAVAFARNPMLLANLGYDLHLASGGRFVLGLGSQIKPHIEKRFSMPWSKPAARMEELIAAIRAIWDCWQNGTKLDFRGEFYTHSLMTPFFNPGPNPEGIPKIYVAAVGPLMTRAVARQADGLLVHPFHTPRYLMETTVPVVRETLAEAGREAGDFDLSLGVMTATGLSEETVEKAIAACRAQIAFYASTPAYRPVLEAHGWEALQGELNPLSKKGEWEQMTAMIDDDILNTFAVVAPTPEAAATEIKRRYQGVGERLSPAFYSPEAELAPRVLAGLRG